MLKNKIKRAIEYYDASKRENVEKITSRLLTSLLIETENDEIRDIEESISDIINMKSTSQSLLSLKLGFNTPTEEDATGDYLLGKVLKGEKTLHDWGLRDEELSSNLFVSGITGSGKTTTVMTFLYQWCLKEKSAIIFDWKADYINLLKPLQGQDSLTDCLWIFSVGVDGFRFNPLRPPETVDTLTWIETFTDMFIHAFGLREPSASILVRCLKELYEESESYPTLAELRDKVADYQPLSNYDRESKRSILTRLILLTEATLGSVFSTKIGVKLEDLLKKFVVLDLSRIPLLENKRFLIEVVYGMVYEYLKAKDDRDKTKGLFVIEEAHNMFGPKTNFDKDIMLKPEIALCEMRDFGWGTIVVDQQPSKLSSEVIANTATKICHKLVRKEDREAMANAMGLNKEQSEHLGLLSKGEVFLKLDRDSFSYPFHARIEPITFTGQVTRNQIREYMQTFFKDYSMNLETKKEPEHITNKDMKPIIALERKPSEIHPQKILDKQSWFNSLKRKMQNLNKNSEQILTLLGQGLGCKASDFKQRMKMTGSDFKCNAISLSKQGLIGFRKMRAPGNPILYFLRPEGLAAFHVLTGKWPYEFRASRYARKHRHSEMKEHVIEKFRKVGWKLTENKVESGIVDICLKRNDLTIPVEICTGSNKYEQIYRNILKCVEAFGGVYFVCDNDVAYNLVLQQASKFSFDYRVNFVLYVILYENFLKGKDFEKYAF